MQVGWNNSLTSKTTVAQKFSAAKKFNSMTNLQTTTDIYVGARDTCQKTIANPSWSNIDYRYGLCRTVYFLLSEIVLWIFVPTLLNDHSTKTRHRLVVVRIYRWIRQHCRLSIYWYFLWVWQFKTNPNNNLMMRRAGLSTVNSWQDLKSSWLQLRDRYTFRYNQIWSHGWKTVACTDWAKT